MYFIITLTVAFTANNMIIDENKFQSFAFIYLEIKKLHDHSLSIFSLPLIT